MENKIEIWKSLPGVTGIEVSTFGRVRSLDKVVSSEKYTRFTKGHVLKQYNDKDGYLQVSIPIDGKWAMKKVHRLVAQTFISNLNNFPQVNHRDCNRTNNNVENLEFCTASYNNQYREKYGVSSSEARGHPLFAIKLTTLEFLHFRSQGEASRELGLFKQNISKVIKGKYKSTGGFWFVRDDESAENAINRKLNDIKEAQRTR